MMIQSDELIFFRGVVIPPTRKVLEITLVSESGDFLDPGRTAVCVPTYHASNKTDGTWPLLLAIAGQDVPEAPRPGEASHLVLCKSAAQRSQWMVVVKKTHQHVAG